MTPRIFLVSEAQNRLRVPAGGEAIQFTPPTGIPHTHGIAYAFEYPYPIPVRAVMLRADLQEVRCGC